MIASIISIVVLSIVLAIAYAVIKVWLGLYGRDSQYEELDYLTKDELIDYIGDMKYVKLNTSDLKEKTCDLELVNDTLIPMEIEYYNKLTEVLPLYVRKKDDKPRRRRYKKFSNVLPEFDAQTLVDSSDILPSEDNIVLDFLEDCDPKHKFNNSLVTMKEFNDGFAENVIGNKDLIGITKKILSNMNDYHKIRIIRSYNDIYKNREDVNKASFGRGTLIYKENKQGPKDLLSSFRMIITVPVVVNHFHRLLNLRLTEFMIKNNFLDVQIQKGGIIGQRMPILQHVFKVKSSLRRANKDKNRLGVMFLDITNAYGSLNRDALYEILENYGVDKTFTDYIRRYYDNFEYFVKTKNWTTEKLKMNIGLLQGDPMSALLFNTALNSVFTHLCKKYQKDHGYPLVSNENLLLLAFIDDICLICKDRDSLITVYTELKELLGRLGFKLHPKKSGTMLINHNDDELAEIDGIPNVSVYKYLGEYITPCGTSQKTYTDVKRTLNSRLAYMNKKDYDNTLKLDILNSQIVPWLRRKVSVMYDLTKAEKLKYVNIIRYHTKDWGLANEIRIFSTISELFKDIDDKLIRKCLLEDVNDLANLDEEDSEGEESEDEEYEKYVVRPTDYVKFDYKEIENDDVIEI